jgi:4-amino-4-deoxy-L-arabinose transferase-like glycosyltransferase
VRLDAVREGTGARALAGRAEAAETGGRAERLAVAGVLLLAVVLTALPAGQRPFWSQDEARFAVLARDIVEHGRWLVPEQRGEPYLNKPQLYFWSIALASLPGRRVTEWTAALPSVLSALATVAGVVAAGRLLWGAAAGVLAGAVLGTAPVFFYFGHQVLSDVMMNAWLTWALYWLLRAWRDGWAAAPLVAFYACVGGAVLSKGPAGLVGLAGALAVGLATEGRRGPRRLRPLAGLGVLALVLAPWIASYVATAGAGGMGEVVARDYTSVYFRPALGPRLMQMLNAIVSFLPWAMLLLAVPWAWRRDTDAGWRLVLLWTLTAWVLLTLSGNPRSRYLLPLYPGLALLTAGLLARVRGAAAAVWLGRAVLLVAAAILGLAAAVLALDLRSVAGSEGQVFVPEAPWERAAIAGLGVGGAVVLARLARRRAFVAAGLALAGILAGVLLVEGLTYPARYARLFDVRPLAAAAAAQPGRPPVVGYPDLRISYDFYLGRAAEEVASREALDALLRSPTPRVLVMSRRDWDAIAPTAPGWRVLAERVVGQRAMVAVGAAPR